MDHHEVNFFSSYLFTNRNLTAPPTLVGGAGVKTFKYLKVVIDALITKTTIPPTLVGGMVNPFTR
jgi:hypothetical protein